MKPLKGGASRDYGDVHTDIARVVQDAHRALGEVGDYLKLCSRRLHNFGREPLLNCGCGSDALHMNYARQRWTPPSERPPLRLSLFGIRTVRSPGGPLTEHRAYQYIGYSTNILVACSPMNARSKLSLLEQVLGARSKIAVLRSLFNSKLGHSGGAIARQTGVGLYAVQKTLATLEGVGLVDVERGPVENRYRLNTHHYLVANGLSTLFEGERRMPQALARELGALLKGKVISAGLFGSFPRGAARAGSDIDLFVVVQTLKEKEQISQMLTDAQADLTRRYGWPVQAVIFERRRLVHGLSKGQPLFDDAAANWQHVTGQTPHELRKSLGSARTSRSRS